MKIGILNIDGHRMVNLALMKISSYHKAQGDQVEWVNYLESYHIAYLSKLFDFSKTDPHYINADQLIKGGTGFDVGAKLHPSIENCQPDYSIYPNCNYSIQFFSRGCMRNCKFCVVSQKEGKIKPADPLQLNPDGKHIEVLDNNFFANPEWEEAIQLLIKWNQPVNFHGLDVRIMDQEQAFWLNKLKHKKQIHIAWDLPKLDLTKKLYEVIKYIKPYKLMCYVLIGFDSTPEQDMFRVMRLKELKISPYVMPFDKSDPYQKRFARWVNHKAIFASTTFDDYRS